MKQKLFFPVVMLFCITRLNAQSNWSLRGNSVNDTDFVGTTNAKNLMFKANNISSFKVKTNGRTNFMYSVKIDSILDVDSIHTRIIRAGNNSIAIGSTPGVGNDEIRSSFGIFNFGSMATTGSYTAFSDVNFNIGFNSISTYDPNRSRLNVNGGASIGNTNTGILAPTNGLIVEGRTGVGASAPVRKMEVYESSSVPQFRISSVLAPNPLQYTDFETTNLGNLRINPSNTRSGFNLSGTEPQNTVEIREGTAGNSGLRFTNLTNSSSSITNTTDKILSVNSSGDVILVDDKQGPGGGGVNYCTGVPNDFLMKKDAATNNLCASGVYEVPSGTYINNIGIGSSTSNNLRSKLNVNGNTKIGSGYVATATSAPANGMVVEGNTGIGRSNGSGQLVEARLHVNTDASFTTFPSATQRNFFLGTASDRSGFRDAFTMFTSGTNGNETATIQAVGRGGDGQVEALVSTTGVRLTSAVNGGNAPGIEPVNQPNEVLALGGDTIFPNTTATGSTCSFTGAIFGDYTHHWGRVYTHDIWQSRSTNPRFFRIRPGNARDVNNTDCAMYLQTGMLYNNASYFRIIGPPTGTGTNNFCQNGGIGSIVPLFEVAAGGNVGIRGFVPAGITGLWVNGDITVTGSYLPSDERIKKNIQEYHTGLDAIRQVNVKSYQYKTKLGITDTVDTKVGVIAQELMQVLPNAVDNFLGVLNNPADSTEAAQEILRIDQNVLLFTTINAIKELDSKNQELDNQNQELVNQNQALAQTLEQQNQRIDEILQRLEQCCRVSDQGNRSSQFMQEDSDNGSQIKTVKVELSNSDKIVLNQNEPNPFKDKTIIRYSIPNEVKQAEIIFFDNNGSIIKTILIETRGIGQLEVYSSNLSAGTYSYSLVADGISIDTKKMVNVK
jgi:hypothetical protein